MIITFSAVLSFLSPNICVSSSVEPDKVFDFRLATDPPTLDPALSTDTTSGAVVLKIFDGLVQFDPDTLEVIPAVAERYEISPDSKVYTFYLRDDVFFHNGRKVVAQDVKYSFERTLNPATRSPRTFVLDPLIGAEDFMTRKAETVSGIEVVDDYTVRLEIKEPFAPFLAQLCMEAASIVPREECEKPSFKYQPVGCGPFRFVRWQRDVEVELAAFDDFYGYKPHIERIRFRIIPSVATAFEEYKAGGLDLLDQIPPGQVNRLRSQFPEDFKLWPYLSIYYIGFNHAKSPFKDNPLLRKAFNLAVDREKICLAVKEGVSSPVAGILPPGIPGYNPDLVGYSYDPAAAARLLEEAGYPEGKGLPPITLWHNRDPRHRLIGECIQHYLKKIGVELRLKNVEWAAYLEACEEGQPLMFRMGWVADYPDADNFLYTLLHSSKVGADGNYSRYVNPDFDRLIEKARRVADPEERIDLYRKAEKLAVEDAAWLFIYYDREVALIKPSWKGLYLTPQGDFAIPLRFVRWGQ